MARRQRTRNTNTNSNSNGNFSSKIDELNDSINNLIDTGNFPELKIIDPDGLTIKKEEIEELQEEFAKKLEFVEKLGSLRIKNCHFICNCTSFNFLYFIFFPFYWCLHYVAGIRALYYLITRPFYWSKTEHGVKKIYKTN